MATVTVTETTEINGKGVKGIDYWIQACADDEETAAPAYYAATGKAWGDVIHAISDGAGYVAVALEPPANLLPANVVYRVVCRYPGSRKLTPARYISPATSPSSQTMYSCLTSAPASLTPGGAAPSSGRFVLTQSSTSLPNATTLTGTPSSAKYLRGDYAWTTLEAAGVPAVDNTGTVQASLTTQGKIDGLERRSVTNRLSSWYSWGHSFGQLGASSNRFLYHRRLTDQLGVASARNQHVSGSKLLSIGARSGGVVNMMQMWEPPLRSYNAQSYPPAAGAGDLLTGINDIQTWATVSDWAQLKEAMRHQYRAACSWSQAAAWWQHDESSTGQAFGGSGSWSTASYVTALEVGPGSSRRRNSSAGATYTVTTGTAEAGLVVALIFLTNYTGGSLYASSISITLDGAAYSTIDTRDINPSSVATGGVAVARVQLPDDGAAHTIVATAGTGGMEVCGRLVEVPRPFVLCNVARRGGDDGYTPNGSSAIVTEANSMIAAVAAEFTSGLVVLADFDTGVGSSAANFSDDLHPNDRGHELIARTILAALDGLTMTAQQRGMF